MGENWILKQLTKAMIERCLPAEMGVHLGCPKYGRKKPESANARNGTDTKTLKSEHGELEINVLRDRGGSFEPMLVKKRQTQLEGFEEKILALYVRGMATRDIQAQLQELYGVEVSDVHFLRDPGSRGGSAPIAESRSGLHALHRQISLFVGTATWVRYILSDRRAFFTLPSH